MKRLYYIRHGETEMNATNHWAGSIETPLTSKGVAQAKSAGKNLKEKQLKIDLIVSSPLSRANNTAKYIAHEIGYPIDKIRLNKLLIERDFGELEGKPNDFIKPKNFREIDDVKGSESVEELQKRAEEALEYLQSLKEDNVLVVAHGSFGRALIRVVKNLPHHLEYDDEHRASIRIGNAELVELI